MTRRGFLGVLSAALAGAVLDPERLLWVPGQRTIFLPPVRPAPVMFVGRNNTLVTPSWVMKEGLFRLKQQLVFSAAVNRRYDEDAWP